MNKEQIKADVERLLFQDSEELSRDELKELLEEISEQCMDLINAMDAEDE